jgi:hypothetical protein
MYGHSGIGLKGPSDNHVVAWAFVEHEHGTAVKPAARHASLLIVLKQVLTSTSFTRMSANVLRDATLPIAARKSSPAPSSAVPTT